MLFLLLACISPSPDAHGQILGPAPDTAPDTDSGPVDTAPDTDPVLPLRLYAEEYRCEGGSGSRLDVNLLIPTDALIQSYVLVSDGGDGYLWLQASTGVVLWDADGADLSCSWTPGPIGQDTFWSGYSAHVLAVRVVWVARGD